MFVHIVSNWSCFLPSVAIYIIYVIFGLNVKYLNAIKAAAYNNAVFRILVGLERRCSASGMFALNDVLSYGIVELCLVLGARY